MISAWPALRRSNDLRSATRSAEWRTTGNAWYWRNSQVTNPPLKYSDFAMLHVSPRGTNAGTIGGSSVAEWLGQMISGPLRGTLSRPTTLKRPNRYVRVSVRISQRSQAHTTQGSFLARRAAR